MGKQRIPLTRGILQIKESGVDYTPHLYTYDKDAVTESAASELGISIHQVIKTLVMEDSDDSAFLVLMHGDKQVSTKKISKIREMKFVRPTDTKRAEKYTGYKIGGISPFGTRRNMKIYLQESVLILSKVYINGGRRGLLIEMAPDNLVSVLEPEIADIIQSR